MLVTIATRGGIYLPPFHGRIQVALLGEENADGTLSPPRLRPRPNSPVFALTDEEATKVLQADGDIRLGIVAGKENLVVGVPSTLKSVLPRHTAVLGTTGGGKSTTIARLVQQAQAAGMAVILPGRGGRVHLPARADRRPGHADGPGPPGPGAGWCAGEPDAVVSSDRPRHRQPRATRIAGPSPCSSPGSRPMR